MMENFPQIIKISQFKKFLDVSQKNSLTDPETTMSTRTYT